MKTIKPNVVFSKGGFVSFPVVFAAHSLKIPTILHESDITPGLANKLSLRYCDEIFTTFDNHLEILKGKEHYVGAIVREDIKLGNRKKGLEYTKLDGNKPILLIMGGSSGAKSINEGIYKHLDKILATFDIIHICGNGNINKDIEKKGYVQFKFVKEELKDILNISDVIISRAGANSIFEFLSIRKPMLLIPLPLSQSRGDQILNAKYFEEKGYCKVLKDEDIDVYIVDKILEVYKEKEKMKKVMLEATEIGSLESVVNIIDKKAKRN